jgi:hypothetical protein
MPFWKMLIAGGIAAVVTLPFALFIGHQWGVWAGFAWAVAFSFAATWLAIHQWRRLIK